MTKNRPIQIMIGFAVLSVISLVGVQVYWVSLAVDEHEQSFDHNVRMSLRSVADNMCQIDGNELIQDKPIDRVSGNYFIARLRYNIDVGMLERLISNEFEQRNVLLDYEYGVYNCETDRMVFGSQVSRASRGSEQIEIPKLKEDEYYFGVYFPNKRSSLLSEMNTWKYMTGGSVLMLAFFSYGLVVVLRQRRLTEVQHAFIDNVTHELKTPIATLKLASESLKSKYHDDAYVDIVQEEAERLQAQVDQILQASIVDDLHEDWQSIDVNGLLDKLVAQYRKSNPSYEWRVAMEGQETIKTIPGSLEISVRNLLENAIKYGNGMVGVRVSRTTKWLEIKVSDNGPGVPHKYRKKIFKKFFRVPTHDVHDVKGYGLGMFLVAEHVRRMGGAIEYDRRDDETIFSLKLPVR